MNGKCANQEEHYVKCNGKPKQKQAYSYLNVKSEKRKQNKNSTNI